MLLTELPIGAALTGALVRMLFPKRVVWLEPTELLVEPGALLTVFSGHYPHCCLN